MNYSTQLIPLRDYPPFSKRRQSEFKLEWNVISFIAIGSDPAVPTDKFMGRL